jgi:integration host factor subunit alpha
MTKADLVDLIYERVGSPKKEAGEVVEAVFAIIRESLRQGSKVKISGFGTFIVSHRRAHRGRNPQTGAPITICFPLGAILQAEPDPQGSRQQQRTREVTTNKIRFQARLRVHPRLAEA